MPLIKKIKSSSFNKYTDVSGRARRSEYSSWVVLMILSYSMLLSFDHFIGKSLLAPTFIIASIIPSVSISIRRLHDLGFSSLYFIVIIFSAVIGFSMLTYNYSHSHDAFVSIIGAMLVLFWLVSQVLLLSLKGQAGKNKYGEDPKANLFY